MKLLRIAAVSLTIVASTIVSFGLTSAIVGPGVAHAQEGAAYPIEIINRPFTLPSGAWQAGLDLFADKSFDAIGTSVGFDYGLLNELQVGLSYSFLLKDFEAKGDLALAASYLYLGGDKLSGLAVAGLGYSFLNEGLLPLEVGSLVWYTINPKMAVYAVPLLTISLADEDLGDGGAAVKPIFLALPVNYALQVTSTIYVEVGTELAQINISDSNTLIFGADYIPLSLIGFLSLDNKLDFGAAISWGDLSDDAGAFDLLALVRYRGGV